jgi:inhibitor of KinA sporulation pathway (predicted exonuclease)
MAKKFLQRLIQRNGPLLVIDLEATCARDGSVPKQEMEIIEIGAVAVDRAGEPFDRFQAFVRPVRHPRLTEFCHNLTTIRQADVDSADRLPELLPAFRDWIAGTRATHWGSWGMFDRLIFDRDFRYHGLPSPLPRTYINLKECFEQTLAAGASDFDTALRQAGLQFEGQPHRGIDDAHNIARLLPAITASAHASEAQGL